MATKVIRKCFYCGKGFDINSEDFRMARINRYSHVDCFDLNYTEDEGFIDPIYTFLKEEVGMAYDYLQCEKQRLKFIRENGYTNEGILKALKYYYEVLKGTPEKAQNRIGIVVYIYNEAQDYYSGLEKKKNRIGKEIGAQLDLEKIIMKIGAPEIVKEKDLIDLDLIEGK